MSQEFAPDDVDESRRRSKSASIRVLLAAVFWKLAGALAGFWLAGKSLAMGRLHPAVADAPKPTPPRGRAADQPLALAPEESAWSWAGMWAGISAAAALAGGVGFLIAYWTYGDTQTLGGMLAVFFAGLALTLTLNARRLTNQKLAVEPREELRSSAPQRSALAADFQISESDMSRRGLLRTMTAAGAGLMAAMSVSLLRSMIPHPYRALESRIWRRGQNLMMENGRPVRAGDLLPGSTVVVFPEDQIGSEEAQTVLIRVGDDDLKILGKNKFVAPGGYLAFSRVCTHAGCPVGLYEKTTHLLMCPCHQSTFDVLRGARPTGGPAAQPLPRLPLCIDTKGYLRAAGGFNQPPGPGFWGMPT